MNTKIYIHEFIDIIGHNRAKYMHHMTANWVPVAIAERNMRCFGVWAHGRLDRARGPRSSTCGSSKGWDGLAANFAHELRAPALQDPSLAEWWAVAAASCGAGGFDRIARARAVEPDDRRAHRGRACSGEAYAHELVTPAGRHDRAFLEALDEVGRSAVEAFDLELRRRVPRRDAQRHRSHRRSGRSPTGDVGRTSSRRGTAPDSRRGGARSSRSVPTCSARCWWMRRSSPMRIGRQPAVEDRRPLSEISMTAERASLAAARMDPKTRSIASRRRAPHDARRAATRRRPARGRTARARPQSDARSACCFRTSRSPLLRGSVCGTPAAPSCR